MHTTRLAAWPVDCHTSRYSSDKRDAIHYTLRRSDIPSAANVHVANLAHDWLDCRCDSQQCIGTASGERAGIFLRDAWPSVELHQHEHEHRLRCADRDNLMPRGESPRI
jgi:hypothetical protein